MVFDDDPAFKNGGKCQNLSLKGNDLGISVPSSKQECSGKGIGYFQSVLVHLRVTRFQLWYIL